MHRELSAVFAVGVALAFYLPAVHSNTIETMCTLEDSTQWQRFVVAQDGNYTLVYAAGVNKMCRCTTKANDMTNVFELQDRECIMFGPRLDSVKCNVDDPANVNIDCDPIVTDQDSKILLLLEDWLVLCGNLHQGECEMLQRKRIGNRIEPRSDMEYKVASNLFSVTSVGALTAANHSDAFLFAGATFSKRQLLGNVTYPHREIAFYRIPPSFDRDTLMLPGESLEQVTNGLQYAFMLKSDHESQPPHFVSALSDLWFHYLFSVQKVNHKDVCGRAYPFRYQTRIARVCKDDMQLKTLLELVVTCRSTDNKYNYTKLVQARFLAKSFNATPANEREETLFLLMRNELDERFALCFIKMNRLYEAFYQLASQCANGTLQNSFNCLYNTDYSYHSNKTCQAENTSNYEDKQMLGMCRDGRIYRALKQDHIVADFMYDIDLTVTAFWVGETGEGAPIGVLGTQNGSIVMVAYKPGVSAQETTIVSSQPILQIERSGESVKLSNTFFVLASDGLRALQSTCGQHLSCNNCTLNPFCGWCALVERCTSSSECSSNIWQNRYLTNQSDVCPNVTAASPRTFSVRDNIEVTLQLENVEPYVPYEWNCAISYFNRTDCSDISMCVQRATAVTRLSDSKIVCSLPPLEENQISLALESGRSTLLHTFAPQNDTYSLLASVSFGAPLPVVLYDCNRHKDCLSCTGSPHDCNWCVYDNVCVHNKSLCTDQAIIHLETNHCPQINCSSWCEASTKCAPTTDVPLGQSAVVDLIGAVPQEKNNCAYQCQLTGETEENYTTRWVNKSLVECDFNALRFQCVKKSYNLTLLWQCPSSSELVPFLSSNLVNFYNCSGYFDCTSCSLNRLCSWCYDTCLSKPLCPSSLNCTNPTVTSVSPNNTTIEGNVYVVLTGSDLGNDIAHNNGTYKIFLAGVFCPTVSAQNTRVTCMAEAVSESKYGYVTIARGDKNFTTPHTFNYYNPSITNFTPKRATRMTNTTITIDGFELKAGSKQEIYIGEHVCLPTNTANWNNSRMWCRLPPVGDTSSTNDEQIDLKIEYDTTSRSAAEKFLIVGYPNVSTYNPKGCLFSGNIVQDVYGRNMIADNIEMVITFTETTETNKINTFYSTCSHQNVSYITCICPSITAQDKDRKAAQVKFLFDSYSFATKTEMTYSPDPIITKEDAKLVNSSDSQQKVTIIGSYLNPKELVKSYNILVGTMPCTLTEQFYLADSLTCIVSNWHLDDYIVHDVKVYIGNLSYFPYKIARSPQDSDETTIIIILSVIISLIVLAVISAFFYYFFIRVKRKYEHTIKELDGFESGVRNEAKQAFTELQIDMNAFITDLPDQDSQKRKLPYLSIDRYLFKIMFPERREGHPILLPNADTSVASPSLTNGPYDCWTLKSFPDVAVRSFETMIKDREFLMLFISTLEAEETFTIDDRSNFASLLFIAIIRNVDYTLVILRNLLEHLVRKSIEKNAHRMLFRQSVSMAEKFVSNWLSFCFYPDLNQDVGRALFCLYCAVKLQIHKGPVDFFTAGAKYTLAERNMLRQKVESAEPVTLKVDIPRETCEALGIDRSPAELYADAKTLAGSYGTTGRLDTIQDGTIENSSSTVEKGRDNSAIAFSAMRRNSRPFAAKQMRLEDDDDLDKWKLGRIDDLDEDDDDSEGPTTESVMTGETAIPLQPIQDAQIYDRAPSIFQDDAVYANQEQPKKYFNVRVLQCDCITQVKQKILDTVYRFKPNSMRLPPEDFELQRTDTLLEMRHQISNILADEDSTNKVEGGWKKLNTVDHYGLSRCTSPLIFRKKEAVDGNATVNRNDSKARSPKYSVDVSLSSLQKAPPTHSLPGNPVFNKSSSMRMPFWRTFTTSSSVSTDKLNQSRAGQGNSLTSTSRTRKLFHLEKPESGPTSKQDRQKLILEVCLPRMMVMKSPLEKFIDDAVFSIVRSSEKSSATKYLFDYLVEVAHKNRIHDTSIHMNWKTNALMLRFWVNILHNPNFVFDVHKCDLIDSNLGVIAQAFIDGCSQSPQPITKDSPASKLLFTRDSARYRQRITQAYQRIIRRDPVTDQALSSLMAEIINESHLNFDVEMAIKELLVYATTYSSVIQKAIDGNPRLARRCGTKFREIVAVLQRGNNSETRASHYLS